MIVDDRIVIIGSANLTDRSLIGFQDSEIAIRIEDSFHQTIQLGGNNWQAGSLPHNFRLLLMKQHTGYSSSIERKPFPTSQPPSSKFQIILFSFFLLFFFLNLNAFFLVDLIDLAYHSPQFNDPFNRYWYSIATNNSKIYDFLDGPSSPHRCSKFDEFRQYLKIKSLPSYFDERVRESVHQIQGHLIHWPIGFLKQENFTNIMSKKYSPPIHMLSNE